MAQNVRRRRPKVGKVTLKRMPDQYLRRGAGWGGAAGGAACRLATMRQRVGRPADARAGVRVEPGNQDEARLIERAKRGDKAAFGALVRQHERFAYASAYSIVRHREDALDLAQEAFVRAFRALDRFEAGQPFRPWLYQIVRNAALNALKKRQRRGERSLDTLAENGIEPPSPASTPDAKAAQGELRVALEVALQGLTPEQREIIQLRHFLELSYAEIADCLEIPIGTVLSRLHGARKALARAWAARGAGE